MAFDLPRRQLLVAGAALLTPRLAFAAAPTERRFVFIIQRGAADGLGILAPVGDPAFAGLRGDLAADFDGAARIDGMFALHPKLATIGGLYAQKQALFLHAVASPYRDRSHFDGQNVLETGGEAPYRLGDGWMNRLLTLLPAGEGALAVSTTIPAALRGRMPVTNYAPSSLPEPTSDFDTRLGALYAGDAQLHALWTSALATKARAGKASGSHGGGVQAAAATGSLAAALMRGPAGARVAMIETNGWDTHTGQRTRLSQQLAALDAMVGALQQGLGADWGQTVVLIATEFGRTAAANGTGGTDHGTGSLAMLLGGGVAGGRVLADWPGLAPAQLFENRDLRPTQPLDGAIAGALAGHYGLDPARTLARLFPAAEGRATDGLVAA